MAQPDPPPRSLLFPRRTSGEGRAAGFPRWPVIGIFLILGFGFLAEARAFLMPVTLALLLFFVFAPFRRLMARIGVGSGATAGIVTLGLVVTVVVLGYSLSGPVGSLVENSDSIGEQLEDRFQRLRENFRGIEEAAAKIDELAQGGSDADADADGPATVIDLPPGQTEVSAITAAPAVTQPNGTVVAEQNITVDVDAAAGPTTLQRLVMLGPEVGSQIVFTLVLLFFLMSGGDLMYLKIVQSFDSITDKRAAYLALREIEDSLGRYLGAITIINIGLGVAIGLAMWAWGMPYPLVWGVAGFVLNYIPYIGAMAGTVTGIVVAALIFDDLLRPVLVGLTFLALTSLEGQFVTPQFVSRRLKLNEAVVFATVAMWAWLWSVLGMVVAVPMLVVLRVLCDHVPGMEKLGNFLAGEAPPRFDDPDEDEARVIVDAGEEVPDHDAADAATADAVESVEDHVDPPRP